MKFMLDEAQEEYINEIAVKYGYKRDVLKEVFGMGFVDGENAERLKQIKELEK